jgi:hypothetical protein
MIKIFSLKQQKKAEDAAAASGTKKTTAAEIRVQKGERVGCSSWTPIKPLAVPLSVRRGESARRRPRRPCLAARSGF